MVTDDRADVLRQIAEELLNMDGQREIEDRLAQGDLDGVMLYLLGTLDAKVEDEKVGLEEARDLYRRLDVDPDRASRVRQSRQSPMIPPVQ